MNAYPALFYDFFHRLRLEGLGLSVEQYELFLRGFMLTSIRSKEDLLLYCKTVWLTRPSFREDFERLFEEYYQKIPHPFPEATPAVPAALSVSTEKAPADSPASAPAANETKSELPATPNPASEVLSLTGYETNEVSLNIAESQEGTVQESNHSAAVSAKKVTFLFTEQKHLPFGTRKTQQLLRKLRTPTEKRSTGELNVSALAVRVAKEGFIQQLDFHQKQYGIQRVVWLSDHGGSMLPFEAWERQLIQLVTDTPSVKNFDRYFFHDYPTAEENDFTFFVNPAHTKVKTARQLLKTADPTTIFLIFSDGGAARRQLDTERLSVFFKLAETLRTYKVRMAWLNPARSSEGSVTSYLSSLISVKYPDNDQLKRLVAGL
ncbi:MAG: hypothetical protein U0X91_30455 [Spirosomataceae bacterium]